MYECYKTKTESQGNAQHRRHRNKGTAAQKNHPFIHHSSTTTADNIPASLSTAILFPDAAMRVSRVALPESVFPRLEKCSA
jgi:hypothetical protein